MWKLYFLFYICICKISVQADNNHCGLPDAEQFVDELLTTVRTKFSDKPENLASRNGIVNLYAGEMSGLSTLNWTGPVEILLCNTTLLRIRIPMSTEKPIRARYSWEKKVNTKTVRGVAHARAPALRGDVVLVRNLNSIDKSFRVEAITLKPSEPVEVNVSGLSNISWLWSRAITFVTTSLEKSISLAGADGVRVVMDRILHDLDT